MGRTLEDRVLATMDHGQAARGPLNWLVRVGIVLVGTGGICTVTFVLAWVLPMYAVPLGLAGVLACLGLVLIVW